jgi:uncharacterized integral membrane protein
MQIFLVIGLIIAILAVIFAVQNTTPVVLSFFIWKFGGSLALVVLVALAAGALVGILVSLPGSVKNSWKNKNQQKKITSLEASLEDLRSQLTQAQQKIDGLEKPASLPDVAPMTMPLPTASPSETPVESQKIAN